MFKINSIHVADGSLCRHAPTKRTVITHSADGHPTANSMFGKPETIVLRLPRGDSDCHVQELQSKIGDMVTIEIDGVSALAFLKSRTGRSFVFTLSKVSKFPALSEREL